MEKLNLSYMGSILKQVRIAAKMTQKELGERVGKTARYLQAIENEEKGIGLETLNRILRALNLSADTIVFSDRDTDSSESE
ncbi:helix-turn-helix domain-containing protein [Hungatella hathewayi]|uniref:helix-turn-helix domain-containing protein n=2 Tax=Lachnospiraceae TaxID=186803 RepID=UPI000E4A63D1|nr:helix-turn-helix transcriptional regulator [Hungatella hathewayi]RHB68558.1 XRE family transcriptional regulator [Hungatella hathewayi]